jgi:hypothetical protein
MLHTKKWRTIDIHRIELTIRSSHVVGSVYPSRAIIHESHHWKVLTCAVADEEQQKYGEAELSNTLAHHAFGQLRVTKASTVCRQHRLQRNPLLEVLSFYHRDVLYQPTCMFLLHSLRHV